MSDWVLEAFHEELRLGLENLARIELSKLSKMELIDFIIHSTDLMRKKEDYNDKEA